MSTVHRPADQAELADLIRDAGASGTVLGLQGGGSKAAIGRAGAAATLDLSGLSGLTLHEPAELVVGARAGTPLAVLERHLAEHGQMLAFEPPDWRPMLGTTGTEPTVGGLVATNLSGPRRMAAGACRDALIGVTFVNGLGEVVRSGGRVMKNVTGYDLTKLLAGSWGMLGAITEVVFKVLPRPETAASLAWTGLDVPAAIALMSEAAGSPYEVSGAAHRPGTDGTPAMTVLRIEPFAASLDYRLDRLAGLLRRHGPAERLEGEASAAFWWSVAQVEPLVGWDGMLWRVSVPPSGAAALADAVLAAGPARMLFDWAGGLVWIGTEETDAAADTLRKAAGQARGHAMLVRASAAFRQRHGAWSPAAAPLAALTSRVRTAFDPHGVFDAGRLRGADLAA